MYKDEVYRVAVRVSKKNPDKRIIVFEDCFEHWDWCYEENYKRGEVVAIVENGEDVNC